MKHTNYSKINNNPPSRSPKKSPTNQTFPKYNGPVKGPRYGEPRPKLNNPRKVYQYDCTII